MIELSSNLMSFRRRLRPDPDPEVDGTLASAVVVESDQLDRLRVHHDHLLGSNLVREADDFGQNLKNK